MDVRPAVRHTLLSLILTTLLASGGCDREAEADAMPAAAPGTDTTIAANGESASTRPAEIYFDLTRFAWYREGRPLVHDGRSYMPQADPTTVDVELTEAGSYEGVTYYVAQNASQPVYTIYVPVYYRYWQRFTAPPGSLEP